MNTQDLARARSALTGVLSTTVPLLTALQEAEKILDAVAHSATHRASLEREVTALMSERDKVSVQVQTLASQAAERAVAADAQVTELAAKVKAAEEDAAKTIAGSMASMSEQIAAAQAEATDTLQSIAKAVLDERALADAESALIRTSMAGLQAEHDALAKKLEGLKTNAAKLAASLGA